MATAKKDLSLRSDEIQDIMQSNPKWIIRWGITAIFAIIVIGLFLCWLIRYPEIISGSVRINSVVPPVKIVSQSSGNVTQIFVKDGEVVTAGTIMAEIENPLAPSAVKYIKDYAAQLEYALKVGGSLPLPDTSSMALGDLQPIFNDLHREISSLNLRNRYKMEDAEIADLKSKIYRQEELLVINKRMLDITRKELENAKNKYESDAMMFEKKIISKQEFFQSQSEYNNKQLQFEQLQQSQVQSNITLNNLKLQYEQAGYNKDSKSSNALAVIQSDLKSISSYIYGWQQRFRLIASKDGKVSYLKNLHANQFLKAGEEIFAILQPEDSLVGFAEIPVSGFGKVSSGQLVNISLENFPYYDYGMVEGKVQSIALIPNANIYRVEISLPNGMRSTIGAELKFTPEMIGTAEIVTDDKTVIERIFKSIIKLFQHK